MRTGNENEESRLFAVSSQAVKCGGRSVRASGAQVKREPWPVWGTLEEEWCEGSAAARNPKARPLAAATNGRSALPPCRACIRPKYRCTTALVDNQHRTNLVRSSLTFHQLVTRSAHEIITNNRNTSPPTAHFANTRAAPRYGYTIGAFAGIGPTAKRGQLHSMYV